MISRLQMLKGNSMMRTNTLGGNMSTYASIRMGM